MGADHWHHGAVGRGRVGQDADMLRPGRRRGEEADTPPAARGRRGRGRGGRAVLHGDLRGDGRGHVDLGHRPAHPPDGDGAGSPFGRPAGRGGRGAAGRRRGEECHVADRPREDPERGRPRDVRERDAARHAREFQGRRGRPRLHRQLLPVQRPDVPARLGHFHVSRAEVGPPPGHVLEAAEAERRVPRSDRGHQPGRGEHTAFDGGGRRGRPEFVRAPGGGAGQAGARTGVVELRLDADTARAEGRHAGASVLGGGDGPYQR